MATAEKKQKGRPKHIEAGKNRTFWMPEALWNAIPTEKGKSKTTFICESIKNQLNKVKK